ncbi:hypothetical protein [Hydrogenimonas urashimensis]|uniref:hypothetical protein n=1 Tax=Hydrogenimonas urashimensis TaxID=2740515 RepID=UPI001914E3D4|nr:hypothetical protein [Hydrogenimonas urashimensis]
MEIVKKAILWTLQIFIAIGLTGSLMWGKDVMDSRDSKLSHRVKTLFDGKFAGNWEPYESAGGNFKKFAKIDHGFLKVDVPEGNNWGKTGISTKNAPLKNCGAKPEKIQKLTFVFRPSVNNRFVIALIPASAKLFDEWNAHEARIALLKEKDKPHQLALWIRREEVGRVSVDAKSLDKLQIFLYPDGEIDVRGPAGQLLLQGKLKDEALDDAFKLCVLAHPTHANEPAWMMLKSIQLEDILWKRPISPDSVLTEEQELDLFKEGRLGEYWERYASAGGNFAKHAGLSGDGLVVNVPKRSSWGHVGLKSIQPLVWLDRFGKGAEEELAFIFDPERTTGFVIALNLNPILDGNAPGWPRLIFHWRKTADGKARATLIRDAERKPVFDVTVSAVAPKRVDVLLTPDGARFKAKGLPDKVVPWKELMEGTGIRLTVYSAPDKADEAVMMALTAIKLRRKPGLSIKEPRPAPGVKPLPVKLFFDGKPGNWFERAAVRLDARQCARYEGGKLMADVEAKKTWWGKCGLISSRPLQTFNLDRRIHRTPYRLTWTFDPKATSGIQVMFASGKYSEMWPEKFLYFSFIRMQNGPHKGDYVLDLGGSGEYRRWVSGDWVKRHWDGRIIMELFSDRWLRLRIPDGPVIRDYRNPLLYGGYMTVYAHPPFERGGAHMELKKITGEWVMPEGMTKVQRWFFTDDENFDPDTFLREVVEE